jgi:hypothetical protein
MKKLSPTYEAVRCLSQLNSIEADVPRRPYPVARGQNLSDK